MKLNPYLFFNGQCEEAFRFYEKVLGGKIVAMMTHEQTPIASTVAPAMLKKIIHARLVIKDQVLMASDAPPDRFHKPQGFSVSLMFETPEEAEKAYADLAEGGNQTMPIQETFWAHRFGMLTDRFGIPWMVNCEKKI